MHTTTTATKAKLRTRTPTLHVVSDLTKQAARLIGDWAAQFRTSHVRTVEAIVERGALFNEGKKALGYGNWTKALAEADFSERTAEYFMLIAREESITSDPKFFRFFPATVSGLVYLATRPRELVQDQLNEGRINPNMTKAQLVELLEPTKAKPPAKAPAKKSKNSKDDLTWPTSVDASIKSFFGGAFDCDTRFPGEVVWRRDDESIAFIAAPATDSAAFHNRLIGGAVALFALGQRFVILYVGERRDQFVAEFGYLGIPVVAWGTEP